MKLIISNSAVGFHLQPELIKAICTAKQLTVTEFEQQFTVPVLRRDADTIKIVEQAYPATDPHRPLAVITLPDGCYYTITENAGIEDVYFAHSPVHHANAKTSN